MSEISDPVIIIDKNNPSGHYWDISTITTKVVYEFGRNRPFALAEVSVKKAYFNSAELYWNSQLNCPKDSNGEAILPKIVLGETMISINAYGESYDMYIENQTSTEDYLTFLCYNKAYKLKSTLYLSSLTEMYLDDGKVYLVSDALNPLASSVTYDSNGRFTVDYNMSNTAKITLHGLKRKDGSILTEFVEGTGTNIFRFIATTSLGFELENCVCDKGYSYNYNVLGSTSSPILNSYTESQIAEIKAKDVIPTVSEEVVKLRTGYLCWDIIRALGYLSNRWAFFYDKAYFVDYNNSPDCDKFDMMELDYGTDDSGGNLSFIRRKEGGDTQNLDILQIVDSKDQGSSYVQSSQTVKSENHAETVVISDARKVIAGSEVVFPYPESYTGATFSNAERDAITRKLAFEKLVTFYHPQDCIQFTVSEMNGVSGEIANPDYIVTSVDELPVASDEEPPIDNSIGLVTDGLMKTYYIYRGGEWTLYQYATFSSTRNKMFDVYACIGTLNDRQNALSMTNAPLSFIQMNWPECVTKYTFGNPEFIDSEYQLSGIENDVENSVTEGTTDLSISDKQAAKIVVGNQTLSQLDDDRSDFTGLIMEKNRDKELYRLAGYNNGQLESYFDSQGRILSGNAGFDSSGNLTSGVMIDHTGIVITGSVDPDDKYVPYFKENGVNTVDANAYTIKSGGSGGGIVRINGRGLSTYSVDNPNTPVCTVGTDGQITGVRAAFADTAGSASEADTNYVVIDSSGLRTYSGKSHTSAQLQCKVGSDGAITAGAGAVKLDKTGLHTYDTDGAEQCKVGTDGKIMSISGNIEIGEQGLRILSKNGENPIRFYSGVSVRDSDLEGYINGKLVQNSWGSSYNIEIYAASGAPGYLNGIIDLFAGEEVIATPMINGLVGVYVPDESYSQGNRESSKWGVISYAAKRNSDLGTYWVEFGGYHPDSSPGTTNVSWTDMYSAGSLLRMMGAECTTIRSTASGEGNDYCSRLTATGATFRHDGDGGFFWRAWGYIDSITSKQYFTSSLASSGWVCAGYKW